MRGAPHNGFAWLMSRIKLRISAATFGLPGRRLDFRVQYQANARRCQVITVTACVYVSSVTRVDACRSSSCITFMSAPLAFSNVEYECRKVCQPIRLVMPTFTAAGRM